MQCRRCMKSSTTPICGKCRRTGKSQGFFERRIAEINEILAVRPPLEDLNKLWMKLGSYKAMAEELKISEDYLLVWMGDEAVLKDPSRLHMAESRSWDIGHKKNDIESKMIRELYHLKKHILKYEKEEESRV